MAARKTKPIYTMEDLPKTGPVMLLELVSTPTERRLLPCCRATYYNRHKKGDVPPITRMFNAATVNAQQIRAYLNGEDWRKVKIAA